MELPQEECASSTNFRQQIKGHFSIARIHPCGQSQGKESLLAHIWMSSTRAAVASKRANAQSHVTALRLTQNQSEGAKELTQ